MQVLTPEQAKLMWSAFDEGCQMVRHGDHALAPRESPKVVQGPPAHIGRSQGFATRSLRRTGPKTPPTSRQSMQSWT